MKKLELYFNVFAIFIDSAMIALAAVLAYTLRYRFEEFFPQYPIIFDLPLRSFGSNLLIAIPFLVGILALYGLYNLRSPRRFWHEFWRIAASITTGLMLFVALYFFNQQIFPSRLIVLMSWIFAIIAVGLGRAGLLFLERAFLRRGIGQHRLLVIEGPENEFQLSQEIARSPEIGFSVIETIREAEGERVLNKVRDLVRSQRFDDIICAYPGLGRAVNDELVRLTHDENIQYHYVPDIIESQRTNLEVTDILGVPIIRLKNTPLEGWGRVVKRLFDIIASSIALIIASPLFLLVAIGVKLDSPGKILFIQDRFGAGKPFRFYKFRSMYQELSVGDEYGGSKAEEVRSRLWQENARQGPFLKIKNDPRVTRFGRFIRKTKLDELPQLWSVLTGEMSLVGPRAHVLDEVNRYRDRYRRQFTIKPGVTGLAQITQARIPDLPFEEEIRLNTFYLENWSLSLDLKILFKTVLVLVHRPPSDEYY